MLDLRAPGDITYMWRADLWSELVSAEDILMQDGAKSYDAPIKSLFRLAGVAEHESAFTIWYVYVGLASDSKSCWHPEPPHPSEHLPPQVRQLCAFLQYGTREESFWQALHGHTNVVPSDEARSATFPSLSQILA